MDNKKFACNMVEIKYIDMMKQKEKLSNIKELRELLPLIFPINWHSSKNYEKKLEFLRLAITSNTNLLDLEGISIFDERIV